VATLFAAMLALSCTDETTERPVFKGPDRVPGLRSGGTEDVVGFDRAVCNRVPLPAEFTLTGWINDQVTQLPAAASGADLTLHAMVALESTDAGTTGMVQIGIGSERLLPVAPGSVGGGHIALVIAVDESGSMGGSGSKLGPLKTGLEQLIEALPAGIHFGLVGFSGQARILWPIQAYDPASQKDALIAANQSIRAAGGTNMHAGLELALQMAEQVDVELDYRHVILLTDGRPSRGLVGHEHFRALLKKRKKQVQVSTIGVGDSFDVELLALLGGEDNPTWMVVSPTSLDWALMDAYRTIGSPATIDLSLEVELAPGWSLVDAPGLRWSYVSKGTGTQIQILGPLPLNTSTRVADEDAATKACPAKIDLGTTSETRDGALAAAQEATFSSHPAVDHPGMLLLRVAHADPMSPSELAKLQLGHIRMRYHPRLPSLARVAGDPRGEQVVTTAPLRIALVSDSGGAVARSSPMAWRSLELLRAGEAIAQSLATWQTATEMACPTSKVADDTETDTILSLRKSAIQSADDARKRLCAYCKPVGCIDQCASKSDTPDSAPTFSATRCTAADIPRSGLERAAWRLENLVAIMGETEPKAKIDPQSSN